MEHGGRGTFIKEKQTYLKISTTQPISFEIALRMCTYLCMPEANQCDWLIAVWTRKEQKFKKILNWLARNRSRGGLIDQSGTVFGLSRFLLPDSVVFESFRSTLRNPLPLPRREETLKIDIRKLRSLDFRRLNFLKSNEMRLRWTLRCSFRYRDLEGKRR